MYPSVPSQTDSEIAQQFAKERAELERKRKEREEAHLYMEVQVATEKNFTAYQGFDIVPWKERDTDAAPKSYRMLRTTTLSDFVNMVSEDKGLDASMQRPWAMVNRQNGTCRPDIPIPWSEMSVEEAAIKFGTKTSNFRIFLEEAEEKDADGKPVFGSDKVDLHGIANNRPLMLFLKYYDPAVPSLYGVGKFYAAWQDKIPDISPMILKLMNWPAGTNFKLFEVSCSGDSPAV